MPYTMQEYLAARTQKAADNLVEAYLALPEDKRAWSPGEKARTAIDLVAECALANGSTIEILENSGVPAGRDMRSYFDGKADLVKDWNATKALLDKNTALLLVALRNVQDPNLAIAVDLGFATFTIEDIAGYPLWNMSYHEGQINYIASIIGL